MAGLRGKVESTTRAMAVEDHRVPLKKKNKKKKKETEREREQALENKESLPPSLLHDYFFLMKIEEDGLAN